MRYDVQLNIRVSKKEKEKLEKILKDEGLTTGEFLRYCIKKYVEQQEGKKNAL